MSTDAIHFPEAGFQPLSQFAGQKLLNHSAIDKWFIERQANKGKERGRILAMKLFIKYTQVLTKLLKPYIGRLVNSFILLLCEAYTFLQVLVANDHYFVKANCCAEQKKTEEYQIKMVIRQGENLLCIIQCLCSCPAGSGWSAACKHVGALCFSIEFFSVTGVL